MAQEFQSGGIVGHVSGHGSLKTQPRVWVRA